MADKNEPKPLTVSQLNRRVRLWLENDVGVVWVIGEVSNLTKPSSGHYYFTLKDTDAQLRCVFFRNKHTKDTLQQLQNGQQVQARGSLSLYEVRGDYQLIVSEINETGLGDLYQQFELLKARLASSGLFDTTRKRPCPSFPKAIGIITSESGAALHDILNTLARRYPLASVLVYPSDVQGSLAPVQLISAIQRANIDKRCDVIILARGGGSMEDLWAFNNEQLANAIALSCIPIITGIGHETDFTIADFVADKRAATPTAAAELATPDSKELLYTLDSTTLRMQQLITRLIQHHSKRLEQSIRQIRSPQAAIRTFWQTLDYLEQRIHRSIRGIHEKKLHQLLLQQTHLSAQSPTLRLKQAQSTLASLEPKLREYMVNKIRQLKQQLAIHSATLNAASPLATLERGYAIVSHEGHVIIDSQKVHSGNIIQVQLAKGHLDCKVM